MLRYKCLYNDIIDQHLENQVEDDQIDELFDILCIDDFSRPSLQTILYCPDGANSSLFTAGKATKPDTCRNYYTDYVIKQHRHSDVACSIFICVQKITDIPTTIRSAVDMYFVFANFNRHELSVIRQYVNTNMTLDELTDLYYQLGVHEKLIFDKYHQHVVLE
jgi:hypothetical protein